MAHQCVYTDMWPMENNEGNRASRVFCFVLFCFCFCFNSSSLIKKKHTQVIMFSFRVTFSECPLGSWCHAYVALSAWPLFKVETQTLQCLTLLHVLYPRAFLYICTYSKGGGEDRKKKGGEVGNGERVKGGRREGENMKS